ncbi:hypothetical protein ACFSMW_06740 [Virgibacillus halophilus]
MNEKESIQEMRQKLNKIAWQKEQSDKEKLSYDFIAMYSGYLITKAEEKIKLQERVDGIMQEYIALKNLHNISVKASDMTTKENQRYKQALEFYADEGNYVLWNSMVNSQTEIEKDKGKKARQSLRGDE